MTTVPTWAVILVSIGTPVLTFVGTLIAQTITRRGAAELEIRSRREETMRNLRWAAELAVAGDEARARPGIAQLKALGESERLNPARQLFVDAALAATVSDVADDIDGTGDDAEVIELPSPRRPDIPSEPDEAEGGDGDD